MEPMTNVSLMQKPWTESPTIRAEFIRLKDALAKYKTRIRELEHQNTGLAVRVTELEERVLGRFNTTPALYENDICHECGRKIHESQQEVNQWP